MNGRSATKREVLTGLGAFALGAGVLDAVRSTENNHFCDDEGRLVVHPPAVIDEPGEYALADDYDGPGGGSDDVAIHIRASNVLLDGNNHTLTGEGSGWGVGVDGRERRAEDVTIRNVDVQNWDTGIAVGDLAWNDNHVNAVVENVSATNNEGTGVNVYSAHGTELKDVTSEDNGDRGMYLYESRDLKVENASIIGNAAQGIYFHDLVSGSEFTDVDVIDNDVGMSMGVDVFSNTFRNLTVADNDGYGIQSSDSSGENTYIDSVIENNGDHGMNLRRAGAVFDHVQFRRNDGWQVNTDSGEDPITATELSIGDGATVEFDELGTQLNAVNGYDHPDLPEGERSVGEGVRLEVVDDRYTPDNWVVSLTLDYDPSDLDRVELWHHNGSEWTTLETFEPTGSMSYDVTEDGVYIPVEPAQTDEDDGDDDENGEGNGGDDDENGEETDEDDESGGEDPDDNPADGEDESDDESDDDSDESDSGAEDPEEDDGSDDADDSSDDAENGEEEEEPEDDVESDGEDGSNGDEDEPNDDNGEDDSTELPQDDDPDADDSGSDDSGNSNTGDSDNTEEETAEPTPTQTPTETPTPTSEETETPGGNSSTETATPETTTEPQTDTPATEEDDVIAVVDQTNEQAPGMGIVSAVTAMGGAAYLFARRMGDGDSET